MVTVDANATATGKHNQDETNGVATFTRHRAVHFAPRRKMSGVFFVALCVLGMQPQLIDAQVIAAPTSAGSKPIVGVTSNGIPIVQIATPNGAGVSNNGYTKYNVGSQGLILNNSPGNVLTQQAGYVVGNPNLGSGTARVILNQVLGGTIGKDQKGNADNTNPVKGTELPSYGGFSASPPVALSASGAADSTTTSAISGGVITITDGARQQQLTGQTADAAIASISRDTDATANTLAPIFDKDKIQAGFDITSQLMNQVGTFVTNRAKEADAAKKSANDPQLTPEQRAAAQQQADQLTAEWGPSGTYRQILTALSVAAGGNVSGGVGQFAQAATVAYLQELGAQGVKRIADDLKSESARAALHAIVGCAGADASGASCGAGALGESASSLLGTVLGPTTGMSAEEKQAREDLVRSMVAGIAAASGSNAATATGAGQIEAENNQLAPTQPPPSLGAWPFPPGSPSPPFILPGSRGKQAQKDDGVILDPTASYDAPSGLSPFPLPSGDDIGQWITAHIPSYVKTLADYILFATGSQSSGSGGAGSDNGSGTLASSGGSSGAQPSGLSAAGSDGTEGNKGGATNNTSGSSPMINGVTVTDRATGNIYQGTVDLQPTLDRIANGVTYPSRNDGTTFNNDEGLLPQQAAGYYTEYVVPTPGVKGAGPQRIVTGQNGEVYYTPDHYKTFIPVKR